MNLMFNVLPDPFPPYNRVDKSYRVLNIPHYFPVHNEGEVVVDMKDCATAIREQKKFVSEEGIPLNFVTEVIVDTYVHVHVVCTSIQKLSTFDWWITMQNCAFL